MVECPIFILSPSRIFGEPSLSAGFLHTDRAVPACSSGDSPKDSSGFSSCRRSSPRRLVWIDLQAPDLWTWVQIPTGACLPYRDSPPDPTSDYRAVRLGILSYPS